MRISNHRYRTRAFRVSPLRVASTALALTLFPAQAAAQDVSPPTIVSGSATPAVVDISDAAQTVTMTLEATDDLAGISVPHADTRVVWTGPSSPGVTCFFELASGTPLDAVLEANCSIPRYSETGAWTAHTIVRDKVGNIARRNFSGLLTVNGTPDLTPPTVSSAAVEPTTIDISDNSQTVTLTVNASDDLSGILVPNADTRAIFLSPSNQGVPCGFSLVSGTPQEAVLRAVCSIPRLSEPGPWRVNTIIEDRAGNIGRSSFSGLLTVVGAGDTSPPVIASVQVDPDVINVASSGQTFTTTIAATDDLSGIRVPNADTRAVWRSPSNQVVACFFALASGTPLDGVFTANCFVPQFSEPGPWSVHVIVEDKANNVARRTVNGLLTVQLNQSPVARCRDRAAPADAACTAAASIDDGSFDPDGDPISVGQEPPEPYPLGVTPVLLTVTDSAGLSDSCTASVTVTDESEPVLACPNDLEVGATEPDGAVVTYTATASDNCDPAPAVQCSPSSGELFGIGVTSVVCAAIDASGNRSECSFDATVLSPQDQAGDLIDTINDAVEAGELNSGQGNSLIKKLEAAIDSLNSGNTAGACSQLASFVNSVEAMVASGQLSEPVGQGLIDAANQIQAAAGC